MGFDRFSFTNQHLKARVYNEPVAVICTCGKATTDHTMRERRQCEQEAA